MEIFIIALTSLISVLLVYLGKKGDAKLKILSNKVDLMESLIESRRVEDNAANEKAHNNIENKLDFVNAREEVSKALRKICDQSIAYTVGGDTVNTFKDLFTIVIMDLAAATISTGFRSMTQDIFRTYMVSGGKKIRANYGVFPIELHKILDDKITTQSEAYYTSVLVVIKDAYFNDKNDRFVDLTITFLREELMIITKEWWTFNKIKGTNKLIKK